MAKKTFKLKYSKYHGYQINLGDAKGWLTFKQEQDALDRLLELDPESYKMAMNNRSTDLKVDDNKAVVFESEYIAGEEVKEFKEEKEEEKIGLTPEQEEEVAALTASLAKVQGSLAELEAIPVSKRDEEILAAIAKFESQIEELLAAITAITGE